VSHTTCRSRPWTGLPPSELRRTLQIGTATATRAYSGVSGPHRAADPTGWLMRSRRLAHDYETRPATSEAVVQWSMVMLMGRRLARR
jgi:hypothetical protein